MGTGTKRAADDSGATATTTGRASKVAKTEKKAAPKNGAKKTAKPPLPTADFKTKALPLHVNLTHTPPSIRKEGSIDGNGNEDVMEGAQDIVAEDVGFIGNLTLLPSSFATGSYGWKGSKRITVELQGGDSDGEGGKEKVQVMLTINATVVGSKPAKKANAKDAEVEEDASEGQDEEE
ncbi:hypothetical protein B0H34DRAFT_806152 [Crassisporium funariophilum]|nr:hypothetical protein B0H34DRAFT_806152 [Crassisporium funariophilum]